MASSNEFCCSVPAGLHCQRRHVAAHPSEAAAPEHQPYSWRRRVGHQHSEVADRVAAAVAAQWTQSCQLPYPLQEEVVAAAVAAQWQLPYPLQPEVPEVAAPAAQCKQSRQLPYLLQAEVPEVAAAAAPPCTQSCQLQAEVPEVAAAAAQCTQSCQRPYPLQAEVPEVAAAAAPCTQSCQLSYPYRTMVAAAWVLVAPAPPGLGAPAATEYRTPDALAVLAMNWNRLPGWGHSLPGWGHRLRQGRQAPSAHARSRTRPGALAGRRSQPHEEAAAAAAAVPRNPPANPRRRRRRRSQPHEEAAAAAAAVPPNPSANPRRRRQRRSQPHEKAAAAARAGCVVMMLVAEAPLLSWNQHREDPAAFPATTPCTTLRNPKRWMAASPLRSR